MAGDQVIPEAAVDAAAQSEWDLHGIRNPSPEQRENVKNRMRIFLEAAAPHMRAADLYVSVPCSRCGEPNEQPVPR